MAFQDFPDSHAIENQDGHMPFALPGQSFLGISSFGAAEAAASVVRVRTFDALWPWERSHGSGFVWDTKGHIVTNFHVVRGKALVAVEFRNGVAKRAKVVGTHPDCDLAVLKLSGGTLPRGVKPLRVVPGRMRTGDRVITLGHPGSWAWFQGEGIVSGVGYMSNRQGSRRTSLTRFQRQCDAESLVFSTAQAGPGSSGGPLVTPGGMVAGVNTWLSTGGQLRVAVAIGPEVLRRVVPTLAEGRQYLPLRSGLEGRLGPARAGWGPLFGFRTAGIRLLRPPGKVARAAGLRWFDEIVRIDNQKVEKPMDLITAVQQAVPGAKITLTVRRPGDSAGSERIAKVDLQQADPRTRLQFAARALRMGARVYLLARFLQPIPKVAKQLDRNTRALLSSFHVLADRDWGSAVKAKRLLTHILRLSFGMLRRVCTEFEEDKTCRSVPGASPKRWNGIASAASCRQKCEAKDGGSATSCCSYCSKSKVCQLVPQKNVSDAYESGGECCSAAVCYAFKPLDVVEVAMKFWYLAWHIFVDN